MRSYRKPNPSNVPQIESYIANLKEEIREIGELALLMDSPGWNKVKSIVSRKMRSVETELDNFSHMDDKQIFSALQERLDHKYFLGLVDQTEGALDTLNKKLAEAEDDLRILKGRLG